jgi:NAD(P)-dependent dehydrogenase (short-subunit alcohol dehydrogenase family)
MTRGRTKMARLKDKIAVVTGGSTGIGLATAQRFVQEGAHVFIAGRREAELAKAAKLIGRNVATVQCDVAKLDDLDRLFGRVKEEKGRVDVLFANSGVMELQSIDEITPEHFDKIFSVNVRGLLFTVQKALPLMGRGGSIILNASIGSIKAFPGYSVYGASKAAVRSFARTWMLELKDRGIRVNAISPGPIDTPIFDAAAKEKSEEMKAGFAAAIPIGRMGRPEELAAAVLFLASEESSFVTGIELFVDGGTAQI